MKNRRNASRRGILLIVVLLTIFCLIPLSGWADYDYPHRDYVIPEDDDSLFINPISYDYSPSLDWGYSMVWPDEMLGSIFDKFQNIPDAELQDLNNCPENWGKGWIYFKVSTPWKHQFSCVNPETYEQFKGITDKYGNTNIMSYGNIVIENLRINNSESLTIYPYYYMMVKYKKGQETGHQSDESDWYLEFIYKKSEYLDSLLQTKIKDISLYADAYVLQTDSVQVYKDMLIPLNNIVREKEPDKGIISLRMDNAAICEDDVAADIIDQFEGYFESDEQLDEDINVVDCPGKIYKLDLVVTIDSELLVPLIYNIKQQPLKNTWIIGYDPVETICFIQGPVKNKTISGYYLLTDYDIKDIHTGDLVMSIATEYAGYIDTDEFAYTIYDGIPMEIVVSVDD